MKNEAAVWLPFLLVLVFVPVAGAQNSAQPAKSEKPAAEAAVHEKNVQEYIELLRANVRVFVHTAPSGKAVLSAAKPR